MMISLTRADKHQNTCSILEVRNAGGSSKSRSSVAVSTNFVVESFCDCECYNRHIIAALPYRCVSCVYVLILTKSLNVEIYSLIRTDSKMRGMVNSCIWDKKNLSGIYLQSHLS